MGLEELCERLLPAGQEHVPWSKMAAVLVAARFCEPSSELHIAEDWYRRTALCDLLQLGDEEVNKDRLYRGLDHLLAHKASAGSASVEALRRAVCGPERSAALRRHEHLFRRSGGSQPAGPARLFARSSSRLQAGVHRAGGDLRRLSAWAMRCSPATPMIRKTLQTIVATMEARHGMVGRVWITDRGMASADNLAWLRQTGRRYIIGAPKSELKKFGAELAHADGWRTVQEGVEVKLARHPETGETVILCRSADRRSKERAMHDKFSRRIEEALERLAARIARSKKRLDPAAVNRQIGRILQQNQRAAARFAIALEPDGCPAGFRLERRIQRSRSTTGPRSPKAPMCCAPTSTIGAISSSGRPISSSPRPKPRSGSRKTSSTCGRSGISARIASRRTSSSAFSPSCCGKAWRCGRARRSRKLPAHHPRRTRAHSIPRCRPADRNAWPDPPALRHSARSRPGRPPRPPRHRPAQAHAPRRTRVAAPSPQRLSTQLQQKCSADFSAKALICLRSMVEFAQVGLL